MTAQATTTKPTDVRLSRTGKRPVDLPKGVTAVVANGKIDIKGKFTGISKRPWET